MPEIIPVIHMVNINQVRTNILTCINLGIKKVFLINHAVDTDELVLCALEMKKEFPDLWIGVNLLGESIESVINRDLQLDGIWFDETIKESYPKEKFNGMIFGGLAFKYQKQPKDLSVACTEVKYNTTVAVTSGKGTGKAAAIDKIELLQAHLGSHPLAIASGIDATNILQYKEVNYFLVASSITSAGEIIDADKLNELIKLLPQLWIT